MVILVVKVGVGGWVISPHSQQKREMWVSHSSYTFKPTLTHTHTVKMSLLNRDFFQEKINCME